MVFGSKCVLEYQCSPSSSLRRCWVEALHMVWTLAAPVGGLGSLFRSNWVDSSSLIVKNHRGDLSSLSLTLSLSPSHSVPSPTVSQLLMLLRSHVFTGFLSFFSFFFRYFLPFFLSRLRALSLSALIQSDLSVGEWQQDGNSGNTSRVLSYTIALNNPLGPKTAPVVETQVSPR